MMIAGQSRMSVACMTKWLAGAVAGYAEIMNNRVFCRAKAHACLCMAKSGVCSFFSLYRPAAGYPCKMSSLWHRVATGGCCTSSQGAMHGSIRPLSGGVWAALWLVVCVALCKCSSGSKESCDPCDLAVHCDWKSNFRRVRAAPRFCIAASALCTGFVVEVWDFTL
jgi:hypothetical protein